ncbi:MAG: hypothetical protein C0507_00405 [Cyanobacteria bacterium PR.3.49]|nr:hypothetical protein [Cyanobacteria bacterium PR.3.49]
MINTYFVAYNYRCGNGTWEFDSIELTTEQPMEQSDMRQAVTEYIAGAVSNRTGFCGAITVVISNWILLTVSASDHAQTVNIQYTDGLSESEIMRMIYFVAYNSNPVGTALWHFGNAEYTINQVLELQDARNFVEQDIAAQLARAHGGQHNVVISSWKLLYTLYPQTNRALSKI